MLPVIALFAVWGALKMIFQPVFTPQIALKALHGSTPKLYSDLGGYQEEEIKPTARLVNESTSVFYFRSERDEHVRESFDIIVRGFSGGLHAFFEDGKLTNWIINTFKGIELGPYHTESIEQLLVAIRFWIAKAQSDELLQ